MGSERYRRVSKIIYWGEVGSSLSMEVEKFRMIEDRIVSMGRCVQPHSI